MIAMSDSDVQDVRDLVAAQKESQRNHLLMTQMKLMTEGEPPIQVSQKEKARQEMERRLGIEPGTSTSASNNQPTTATQHSMLHRHFLNIRAHRIVSG